MQRQVTSRQRLNTNRAEEKCHDRASPACDLVALGGEHEVAVGSPLTLCVQMSTRTLPQDSLISAWWFCCSARAPTRSTSAIACLKSGDVYVLVSRRLSRTCQPSICGNRLRQRPLPVPFLEEPRRLERWDNAWLQGTRAGENLTGRLQRYDEMPRFYADLLDIDAIGDISATLDTLVDWNPKELAGTIFYLRRGQVRGVLFCNRPGKLEAARQLITRSVPGDDE